MRTFSVVLLALAFVSYPALGQTTNYKATDFDIKGFRQFPPENEYIDRASIVSKIIPNVAYAYWQYVKVYVPLDSDGGKPKYEIIASHGDSVRYAAVASQNTINSEYGLFGRECHSPLNCYSYIIGVKETGSVEVIKDLEKLKSIIGSIDSIEEVMLYISINGYWIDRDTIIGGAFKERKDDYLLYLLEYSSTPVTYKSVKAILTKSGNFQVLDKKIYKQTDESFID